jgi:hypothetical protein
MRKIVLLPLASVCFFSAYSQTLPDFNAIKLDTKADYDSAADNAALQASNYLLSAPLPKKDLTSLNAAQYLIKWMSGTPDFGFTFGSPETDFITGDNDLMAVYIAAMVKYALQNKEAAKDPKKIELNGVMTLIQYAKDPANNVKPNKSLKKAMEAQDNGQLAAYLKL